MWKLLATAVMTIGLVAVVACASEEAPSAQVQPAAAAPAVSAPAVAPGAPAQPAAAAPAAPAAREVAPAPAAPAPAAKPAPAPRPIVAKAMTEAEKFGGHLIVGAHSGLASFDPLWATTGGASNTMGPIFETLLSQTPDYQIGFQLADQWKWSDDLLTLTVGIRDGVKFHDGTSLTVDEIVATLRRQRDIGTILKLVRKEFGPENFDDFVKKVDDHTFTMHLLEPTALAVRSMGPQMFTPWIVTADWSRELPVGTAHTGDPIGTGPFMFEKWAPGDRWSMVRFEDYSPSSVPTDGGVGKQVAYFDRVTWIELPDETTRVAALEVGEIDLIQEFPAHLLPRFQDNPGIATYPNPPFELWGFVNHLAHPFDKREARQALTMAYDNEKALIAAVGNPDYMRLCPSVLFCGTRWESDVASQGVYNAKDIDGAIKLLKDSGLYGAKVRLMDPTDRQPAHGAAQVTREVLEAIGFDVDFMVMDWATQSQFRADPTKWEFFHSWGGSFARYYPQGTLGLSWLVKDGYVNNYQDVGGNMAALFSKLARASTDDEAFEVVKEIQEYNYTDHASMFIGEWFSRWAADANVKGLYSGPGGQVPNNKWIE